MHGGWGGAAGAWGKAPLVEEDSSPTAPAAPPSNPFAAPQGPGTSSAPPVSSAPHGAFAGSFSNAPTPAAAGSSSEVFALQAKEAELRKKEAELKAKESSLRKLENELRDSGAKIRTKNWPVCFPIWHHDIQGDIPEKSRRVVKEAYICWWGLFFCLSYNLFCASVMLGHKADQKVPSWFLAVLYWLMGTPLSMYLWYKRIYFAAREESNLGYVGFFFWFFIHTCFCIWAAIAIPFSSEQWSFSGFATAIAAFDQSDFAGIVYIIGSCFWVLESLFSLWVLKDSYLFFRGKGGIQQAKQEAAKEAALAAFQNQVAGNASNRV